MKRPRSSSPINRASPFIELETEMFPRGLPCRVTRAVRALDRGRAQFNGSSWFARLYEINCSTTLLPGQPALAVGRQGTTLIIMPLHCLLWPQYLEVQGPLLTDTDITLINRYERGWILS